MDRIVRITEHRMSLAHKFDISAFDALLHTPQRLDAGPAISSPYHNIYSDIVPEIDVCVPFKGNALKIYARNS